ncbi:MAG: chemotaxis protein CheW [Phycisphaerae bacterium]|nr:chemotaxis protein CheW [Phycisphaerae bacterium]
MTDPIPMGSRRLHKRIRQDDHVGLLTDADERDVVERLRTLLQRPISNEDLAENTRMVAAVPQDNDRFSTSLLLFAIGDERLAVDVAFAGRVVTTRPVHSIPHRSNDVFAGICNVNGELLPVARLDRLLGIPVASSVGVAAGERRLVVIGGADAHWAVTVDRVHGIHRFDATTFLAPPSTVARALDGITRELVPLDDGALAARLNVTRLASALERALV